MRIRHALAIAGFAAGIGGLVLPALAQTPDDGKTVPGQSMGGMGDGGQMSRGMMGGMMSGSCSGMMQSMAGGDGRPNSQWQRHRRNDGAPG